MTLTRHIAGFLAGCLFASTSTNLAAVTTGTNLKADCDVFARHFGTQGGDAVLFQKATKCVIYVGGVVDGYRLAAWDGAKLPFCLPEDVGYNQLGLIVQQYLSKHPEDLHKPSAILIRSAVIDAFPCEAP
jgi:hypothetical protein